MQLAETAGVSTGRDSVRHCIAVRSRHAAQPAHGPSECDQKADPTCPTAFTLPCGPSHTLSRLLADCGPTALNRCRLLPSTSHLTPCLPPSHLTPPVTHHTSSHISHTFAHTLFTSHFPSHRSVMASWRRATARASRPCGTWTSPCACSTARSPSMASWRAWRWSAAGCSRPWASAPHGWVSGSLAMRCDAADKVVPFVPDRSI